MMMRRHGFAGATAVTMLAMVGIMLAAMASYIAAEARRTRDAAAETQLRQLLLAGASAATAHLPLTAETQLALPPSLAADGYRLVLRPAGDATPDATSVEVIAESEQHGLMQAIRYHQRDGRWQMMDADLQHR